MTDASLLVAFAGGVVLAGIALWRQGPIFVPFGATALLWWLAINKTFTTHLVLWVFLALALLRVPWTLWSAAVAVDLVGFQLGNFLNLYNVGDFHFTPLIQKAVEDVYDPLQIARSLVLFAAVGWGGVLLWRRAWPTAPPQIALDAPLRLPWPEWARSWAGQRAPASPTPEPIGFPRATTRRQRLLVGAAVTLFFAAATVVMTWPYVRNLSDATVVGFDPLLQIWLSRWVQHALTTDPRNLYGANIFYPFQQTLAYTDANIPGALIAAPIDLLTRNPILTNSLLVLATFVVAAAGVYAVVVRLTGNRAAGILCGLAYAFLPYRYVHLWHLNWLESAWLPWIVLALLATLARPTWKRGALLGFLSAILILTSFYFAIQIAFLAVALTLAALIARPALRSVALYRALGLAALVVALMCVPLDLPYLAVQQAQGLERTLAEAEQYKATPASYLAVAPWQAVEPLDRLFGVHPGENQSLTTVGQAPHADGHMHPEIVIEDALFPGGIAVIAALVGLCCWRRDRWLLGALSAVAAVAFVLSLGPSLGPIDGSGIPLPYAWLFDHAPFFRAMRVPARLGGLAGLAIVLLAGFGFAAIGARLGRILMKWPRRARPGSVAIAGLTALLVLGELAAIPIPLETVDRSPAIAAPYEWLAKQPPWPVMEFPAESIFADPAGTSVRRHYGLTMFWSTLHWDPLVNGNSGFIPRAYSDFIERFVGQLRRPDGSLTGRISHVDADSAALLQQLGVRYLVFHRDQYRAEDWPAVAAALGGAEASLDKVGDVGEATIYEFRQALRPVPEADVSLFAPTLLGPDSAWGPWIVTDKPGDLPSVLSLTRPAVLATTWYDAQGKFLHESSQPIPLPVTTTDRHLVCDGARCRAWNDGVFPVDLPDPAPQWRPTDPGHYVVRTTLSGDRSLTCKIDLDIVDDASQIETLAPDQPNRWAECTDASGVPVNNPGQPPFRAPSPSITFIGGKAAVDAPLITERDEEVQAWFFLATPGSIDPWNDFSYRSPVIQKLVRADEPADFDWLVRVGAQTPPGVYDLTVWFHRKTPDGWEHALGGGYTLAPVVVDPDGSVRWAGPVRLALASPAPPLAAGRSATFEFDISGASKQVACDAIWTLRVDGKAKPVAAGHAGDCEAPRVDLPERVPPGQYTLQFTASVIQDGKTRLSDAVAMPVVVREAGQPGEPR